MVGGPPDFGRRAARFGGRAAPVAAGRPAHHLRPIRPLTGHRFLAGMGGERAEIRFYRIKREKRVKAYKYIKYLTRRSSDGASTVETREHGGYTLHFTYS